MTAQQPLRNSLLVVEDNPLNLLIINRFLTSLGYRFDTVENGIDCLQLLAVNTYDLVLTDIALPGMNGLEIATKIRTLPNVKRNIPIIAMTANADLAATEKFQVAGINDLLAKPFSRFNLKCCIEKWL
jgi:CheY-like chemotaxis protein